MSRTVTGWFGFVRNPEVALHELAIQVERQGIDGTFSYEEAPDGKIHLVIAGGEHSSAQQQHPDDDSNPRPHCVEAMRSEPRLSKASAHL